MKLLATLRQRVRGRAAERGLSEAVVLDALRRLDARCPAFDHMNFDHHTLRAALQEYIGIEIRVERIRDDLCNLLRRSVRRSAIQAELVYSPERRMLTILIPASLHPSERKDAHYHELSHLMAGHPMPYLHGTGPASECGFWTPSPAVAQRRLPFELRRCARDPELRGRLISWCEEDADAWAEHLRAISALGRAVYLREEQLLGL